MNARSIVGGSALAATALCCEGSASEYELLQTVAKRQEYMFDMQTAYLPLLAIKGGKSTDTVEAAAKADALIASLDGFLALLPEGTAKGQVPNSRAKMEIWTEREDFEAAAAALRDATTALSEAARSGDLEAAQARFEAVETACVGCHEFRPSLGGRFRWPK
jgi:cytochrome c556